MQLAITAGLAACLATLCSGTLVERQSCSSDFKLCAPPGAKNETLGPIDSSWANLFTDVINVVSNYSLDISDVTTVNPGGPARRDTSMAFCCSNVADCLLVPFYSIAMCWDRFTTNVFFPDGTYGTVVSGNFNTSDGDSINLVYGVYTLKNGQTGNIYNGGIATTIKPNTSTMPMPKPWTSSGEGSAIPATGLGTTGDLSTGTAVISATTQAASTGNSITVVANMTGCNHCPAHSTVIPGLTQPGTTRSATTSTFTTAIITPMPPNLAVPFSANGAVAGAMIGAVIAFVLVNVFNYMTSL